MESAPPVLIFRGRLELFQRPMIALVGARNASAAACRFARGLAQELGRQGATVVSGLARGIDTAVHEGSLASGTIAVIASGIDIVFPPQNAALQERIAHDGVLLAEQPPGTEPRRSEEHTSEPQSLKRISYAVFCLKTTKHTHTASKNTKTQ